MKATNIILVFVVSLLLSVQVRALPTNSASSSDTKTKRCFQCNGLGRIQCATCRGTGSAECPGSCVKLSHGSWQHMTVAGHPATDLWLKFYTPDGSWMAYNQNHVGDIIVLQNGKWNDIGKCPTCGGSGKVKCATCKATGTVTCPICDGKKVVPDSWTAFDNPKMKNHPTHFKLKDGRVLVGRKGMVMGSTITIRTETGNVDVEAKDIVSEDPPSTLK